MTGVLLRRGNLDTDSKERRLREDAMRRQRNRIDVSIKPRNI